VWTGPLTGDHQRARGADTVGPGHQGVARGTTELARLLKAARPGKDLHRAVNAVPIATIGRVERRGGDATGQRQHRAEQENAATVSHQGVFPSSSVVAPPSSRRCGARMRCVPP